MTTAHAAILAFNIVMGIVGSATFLLMVIPTPDSCAKIFVTPTCPLWYLRAYNLVRFIAHVNVNAGWQERKNGNGTNGIAANSAATVDK